jgi:uncharacterized membrane protein YuzA (DUF378 family)
MEMIKRLEPFALFFMIVGALNWGIVGLFEENLLTEILGTGTFTDVVYVVIGVSGLIWIPRLLEEMHIGHHDPHPRGV